MYCELHLGVVDLCFCGSELAFLYANGKFGPGCFRVVMIEEYTVNISSGIKSNEQWVLGVLPKQWQSRVELVYFKS